MRCLQDAWSESPPRERFTRSPCSEPEALLRVIRAVKFRFLDHRGHRFACQLGAVPRRKHRPEGGLKRRELSKAQATRHIVVNRLHTAAHEICLVPEACSAR